MMNKKISLKIMFHLVNPVNFSAKCGLLFNSDLRLLSNPMCKFYLFAEKACARLTRIQLLDTDKYVKPTHGVNKNK